MNTELENRMEDWAKDHMGYCGTCDWHKRGYCTAIYSDAYADKVADKCTCGEYIPQKGANL